MGNGCAPCGLVVASCFSEFVVGTGCAAGVGEDGDGFHEVCDCDLRAMD